MCINLMNYWLALKAGEGVKKVSFLSIKKSAV